MITIIVLLILAGITLSSLFGDNGILKKAEVAADLYQNKAEEEQDILNKYEDLFNDSSNPSPDPDKPIILASDFITAWTVNAGDSITLPISGTYDVTIDYGDNTPVTKDITHTYTEAGTYPVIIKGTMDNWDFKSISGSNKKITGLIQWGETNAKKINFYDCTNIIGKIPEPTKKSFQNVTDFSYLFAGEYSRYMKLSGSIPNNLFANCPNVIDFGNTFERCTSLTGSIPENLFANCPSVTSFNSTFDGCTSLTGSIPENLFANCPNVEYFDNTFDDCTSLTGSIPENLFANCPNVTYFFRIFKECTGLTGSVPANLFANCTKIEDYREAFRGTNLTNIPEGWA